MSRPAFPPFPPPGFRPPPPPPGVRPPLPPPGAPLPPPLPPPGAPGTDSFVSSTTSTSSTTSASAASSGGVLGGDGGRLQGVMGLLASNPAYGNAGMALGYVLNHVASKAKADLTDVDRGAIQQAIMQMQALVGARAVNPAQAQVLNGAIWQLQGALR